MDYNILIIGLLVLIATYVIARPLSRAANRSNLVSVWLAWGSGLLALAGAITVIVLLAASPSVGLPEDLRNGDDECLPVLTDTALDDADLDFARDREDDNISTVEESDWADFFDACDRERDKRVATAAVIAPMAVALFAMSLRLRAKSDPDRVH